MSSVRVGDIVGGKYRITALLGSGGMGLVVAATHVELGHVVALKLMKRTAAEREDLVARFLREARAACRLRGEHMARVFDVGRLPEGTPYMVMEYLEGEDLASLLESGGPLPPEEAVGYALQACEALAEAHGLGIVHRDIKPANLFLTQKPNGKPCLKMLDFGISKHVDPPTGDHHLTGTLTVIGTPHYMAPEQMRSARFADTRSDIWAIGAVLFHLLTGRPPFDSESLTELSAKVLRDAPPRLRDLRPDLSEELELVVARCLQKDPDARFARVEELSDALARLVPSGLRRETLVQGDNSPTVQGATWGVTGPPSLPSQRVAPALAAAACVLVVGAVALAYWSKASAPAPAAETTATAPLETPATTREPPPLLEPAHSVEPPAPPPPARPAPRRAPAPRAVRTTPVPAAPSGSAPLRDVGPRE